MISILLLSFIITENKNTIQLYSYNKINTLELLLTFQEFISNFLPSFKKNLLLNCLKLRKKKKNLCSSAHLNKSTISYIDQLNRMIIAANILSIGTFQYSPYAHQPYTQTIIQSAICYSNRCANISFTSHN